MNGIFYYFNGGLKKSGVPKNTFSLRVIIVGLMLMILALPNFSEAGIELNRFRNIEDRFKTEEELRPLGHDFLLDVSAAMSKEIMDIIDEAETVSKTQGTDTEKLTAINAFLNKHKGTEQFGAAKVTLGIPLPSFSLFGLSLTPDLRAIGTLGATMTLKTKPLDLSTLNISDIPGIPAEVSTLLAGFTFPRNLSAGTDLVQYAVNQGAVNSTLAAPYVGKYYMPDFSLPNIFLYAKNDYKFVLGLKYDYEDTLFGHFNLYNMLRTDKEVRITEQVLKSDGKIADFSKKNTQSTLNLDYRIGYRYENYQASLFLEDIKLYTLSDKKGPVIYDYDPMFRIHLDASFRPFIFKLSPFLGLHKRKGYTVANGAYGGAEGAMTVWGDRLYLALRTMMDKEYMTFTPSFRLWFIQAEYSFRKVLKDVTVDGNKTSNIHSANFRIFF